ncbi:MAG TPA: PaaI family thioesterase [Candidatus Limnocylindria bacterium]|nr:PaaI family thioesterase [Candidatus Limnocylindria bacterium]
MPDFERLGGFHHALPIQFETVGPDKVVASMELGPDQHTPWGVVHGGVYTAAIETAASLGASAAVLGRGQFAVGVNNNTDFLRPLVAGTVRVSAEPIQQGATQQLWQVNITRTDNGKLVARGQVRLQNVPLPDAPADRA